MERLTEWVGSGPERKAIARQDRRDVGDKDCVARLAAYEDTRLTPERVAELAQAERDGRLVVLPNPHGCPRGAMGPFFECPKCGGHHIKWVADFDLSVCMDCGWDSHEKSIESLIALIRNRECDISILSAPNWRDTLAKRREEADHG